MAGLQEMETGNDIARESLMPFLDHVWSELNNAQFTSDEPFKSITTLPREKFDEFAYNACKELHVDDLFSGENADRFQETLAIEREIAETKKNMHDLFENITQLRKELEKMEEERAEEDESDDVQILQVTQLSMKEQLLNRLPPHLRKVVQVQQRVDDLNRKSFCYVIPGNIPNAQQIKQELRTLHTQPLQRSLVGSQFGVLGSLPRIDVVEGMKVFGKKHSDMWFKGVVTEIQDKPLTERRYKIKFDGKGVTVLGAKHLAWVDYPVNPIPVGSRAIALYRDDESAESSFFAGVVAEMPNLKNSGRYLIFFDDGYAQYTSRNGVHKIVEQSAKVWEDCSPDSRDFIERYISYYPERPMVRLQPGQMIRTEYNGNWLLAKVVDVDASLVRVMFKTTQHTWYEWIYRGTTRFEPLYKEFQAQRGLNSVSRRHMSKRKHVVEYLNGEQPDMGASDEGRKKAFARKSTAKKPQSRLENAMSSDLIRRVNENVSDDGSVCHVNSLKDVPLRPFVNHTCSKACRGVEGSMSELKKQYSSLVIPQRCGWSRALAMQVRRSRRKQVIYQAPCGRKLRTLEEVDRFLQITDSQLTIDMFCVDPGIRTDTEFVADVQSRLCDIKDLSYGKEKVPISCVNQVDRKYPEYVEYVTERVPGKGVNLGNDASFCAGCDCTDGCRDPTKCACIKLTVEASHIIPNMKPSTGYTHRRLLEQLTTGVYECNSNCSCDSRCANRVVQSGLHQRLQVFHTQKKGWGVRALTDIPYGAYISTFTGKVLDENAANKDGKQYGDEYLAELDYIEIVEHYKADYESDVPEELMEEAERGGSGGGRKQGGGGEGEGDTLTESDDASDSDCSVGKQADRKFRQEKKKLEEDLSNDAKDDDVILLDENEVGVEKEAAGGEENATEGMAALCITEPTSLNTDNITPDSDDEQDSGVRRGPRRSTRNTQLPEPKPQTKELEPALSKRFPLRSYYGEEYCYVMDAKSKGNIGRYLNHGCDPNVFVQSVFVDSHDLRFPWVAFFAMKEIRAGAELTWDYNYEVNSVPGKTLHCYCGAQNCRGRLL